MKKVVVSYEVGRTINLGNFENVKISVGIDINTDTDSVDKDYVRAKKWVEKKLTEEEDKWESEKK